MSQPPKKLTGLVAQTTTPPFTGMVQPGVDRPPPQLPQPVVCASCREVIPAAQATRGMFGVVCAGGCGARKPETGH